MRAPARLLGLVAFVSLSAACAGAQSGAGAAADAPHIGAATAADRACSRDVDCVLVDDCCGCSTGGQRLAVTRTRLTDLESSAEAACATRQCAPSPTPHRSCTATAARCAGGLCVPNL